MPVKSIRKVILRSSILGLLAVLWLCTGRVAWAASYAEVIDGTYENCSLVQSGDRIAASFTVRFQAASGNIGNSLYFMSRGLAVFFFDEKGNRKRSDGTVIVTMNGMNPTNSLTEFNSNHTYYRSNVGVAHWSNAGRFTATISAEFAASELNKWPAVGFHVSNESNLDRFYVQKGALYMAPKLGGCRLIKAGEATPPSPVTTEITVSAPDWDLGELARGKETTRTFVTDEQRLCFAYDPKFIEFDKYLISASNRNGVAESKFLLASAENGNETIPYTLSLAGGGAPVALPSINGLPLTLSKSGRTCLTPTFKAWAGATLKSTDFSDVLTFTIVTQP